MMFRMFHQGVVLSGLFGLAACATVPALKPAPDPNQSQLIQDLHQTAEIDTTSKTDAEHIRLLNTELDFGSC